MGCDVTWKILQYYSCGELIVRVIRNLRRRPRRRGRGGHPLTFAAMDAASSNESGSSVGRLLSRWTPDEDDDDDDDAAEWSPMIPLASATAPSRRGRRRRRRVSARTATPSSLGRRRRRRSGDRRPGDDDDDVGDGDWNARAAGAAMMANSRAMDAAARRDAFA